MHSRIRTFGEYRAAYKRSVEEPEAFWAELARRFSWKKPWDTTLEWNFAEPSIQWFRGGVLNISENCLDRHLQERGDKVALIWEPNDPTEASQKITYRQLHERVCRMANVLHNNGVGKGDRVCIYLPMIPELPVALLACARVGAIHSVVFAGFSSRAIADRIQDAACKLVITADGMCRGAKRIPVKEVVDEALQECPTVKRVLVAKRLHLDVAMKPGRDAFLDSELRKAAQKFEAEPMDSEDPLFILYTSGSTGKPKGVVHSSGGYMVYADYTFRNVFQYEEDDVYWCTADIGWITGHSYIVYGPLLAGATSVLFEGIPTWPDGGRFWEVVDKHRVSLFYTAPTAIRALMAAGPEDVERYKLSSLRVLGTVGEPINEEAWEWYHHYVGKGRCPIVDTWWQTETGGILISPLAGITPLKAGFATLPLPGVQPVLLDAEGTELAGRGVEGNLCIKFPWPGMLRTTWGDHERCRQTYFAPYPGYYFTGDGARRDEEGHYRIIGRVDDVINVSGHRFGTAEIENAINEHEYIAESAVVGYPHPIKGQGIWAYVICTPRAPGEEQLQAEVDELVSKLIGRIAKPDVVQVVPGLPKTRSGKIMRRILRKIAAGETDNFGDTSTLLDPEIVDTIKEGALVKLSS
ncbi:acetate--CoA ligase [Cesiribacter andamanensis]|uniref:Acetate--CoA ligase n=1 Tax=Cesiribacter andamanensis AMV16 TaxID=1279009 RepID=M7N6F6_9BACT|nr:acetate--CoA ligase [Cesiribacter andamanensis]EMR02862.1 Acetyl-coenzyme A synthetase [Cesiribacter andamanensis AMV16]